MYAYKPSFPGCVEDSNQGNVWNLATNESKMALERVGMGWWNSKGGLGLCGEEPK